MSNWLSNSIEQAVDVFREFALDWSFSFKKNASQAEIDRCESQLNLSLPGSYRDFLMMSNGAQLFYSKVEERLDSSSWWAGSGIKIFGTVELLNYRQHRLEISSPYNDPEDKSILAFAYLWHIGTGDFCALDTANFTGDECPVLDCDQDYPSSSWKETPIAHSFEEWLVRMFDRVIQHKSLPEYWFSDTLKNNSLRTIGRSVDSVE